MPALRILPAFMNVKLFLLALLVRCDEDFWLGVLTDEIWRELCIAESKIEKSTCSVTNSVVKSSAEFSVLTESDLPIPSVKANAIMMRIRYLMNFFTLIQWVFVRAFCNILPHNNFVCKDNAFF